MAEIIDSGGGGGKGKHQKKRAKKHGARIDMTPMVDLGFLLLTFFVLTSQFSKPKTMEITMPVIPKDTSLQMKIEDQTALTLLLTDKQEKVYYYYGKFKPDASIIKQTNYSKDGIRKLLLERNKDVIDKVQALKEQLMKHQIADTTYKRKAMEARGDKEATFVIIKADDKAKYKNIIDIFDELSINNVDKKALVDMSPAEKKMLEFFK
ncbi:MAG: biopolymer transporter ExbD [Bacteroidetes bacterium]|nr:biopolymer transporter ExbD [Bacteroidota bacterium]